MSPGDIHGLHARIVADLKRELAEAKAEANKVTESMGSEILRLHGEIEQQRTRAEAAEQELRDYTAHVAQSKSEDRSKLAIYAGKLQDKLERVRANLAGVEIEDLRFAPVGALVAAAREALEP